MLLELQIWSRFQIDSLIPHGITEGHVEVIIIVDVTLIGASNSIGLSGSGRIFC
jgi:hypothetical protein